MNGRTFRSLALGMMVTLCLGSNLPAGPIVEMVGKGWDKVASKISKVHEKSKAIKPPGQLIKGMKSRGC